MTERADAHVHLFERPLVNTFPDRPGVQIDEAILYDSLASEHDVTKSLVVCYEGLPGTEGNNDYVASRRGDFDWLRPVAYVEPESPPAIEKLQQWRDRGFVGLTLYITPDNTEALLRIPDEVWEWMLENRWLLSVNSHGEPWSVWKRILDRFDGLRLLISHLGVPVQATEPVGPPLARERMEHQISLAEYPEVRIKLSAFYALAAPFHDYPHELAWPYVEIAIEKIGIERLLWASDFPPCLNHQTFPQTLGLLWKMPFLNEVDRDRIAGGNLLRLLGEVVGS